MKYFFFDVIQMISLVLWCFWVGKGHLACKNSAVAISSGSVLETRLNVE